MENAYAMLVKRAGLLGISLVKEFKNLRTNRIEDTSKTGPIYLIWAYGVVVSMFDFHCSDRVSNPGRGGKIS